MPLIPVLLRSLQHTKTASYCCQHGISAQTHGSTGQVVQYIRVSHKCVFFDCTCTRGSHEAKPFCRPCPKLTAALTRSIRIRLESCRLIGCGQAPCETTKIASQCCIGAQTHTCTFLRVLLDCCQTRHVCAVAYVGYLSLSHKCVFF